LAVSGVTLSPRHDWRLDPAWRREETMLRDEQREEKGGEREDDRRDVTVVLSAGG
jgi:hypothetical protein